MSLLDAAKNLDAARELFKKALGDGVSVERELDLLLRVAETMTVEVRKATTIKCPTCVRRIEMEKSAAKGEHCMCGTKRNDDDPIAMQGFAKPLRACRVCRIVYAVAAWVSA